MDSLILASTYGLFVGLGNDRKQLYLLKDANRLVSELNVEIDGEDVGLQFLQTKPVPFKK